MKSKELTGEAALAAAIMAGVPITTKSKLSDDGRSCEIVITTAVRVAAIVDGNEIKVFCAPPDSRTEPKF
ncbi:MAG TPA: hypothetical protein VGO57_02255 [Verrucomicrobiae bacterium]|jgi:hypothetical protein